MESKIIVACGILEHDIFAKLIVNGKPDVSVCKVTNMAIKAVRDYMVDGMNGNKSIGYSWKRSDGKTVKLVCTVED